MTASTEDVRRYQRDLLGRRGGETAMLELMPLPARSVVAWPYGGAGSVVITDRVTYSAAILPSRIRGIRDLIANHRPRIVVFYGLNARGTWSEIGGGEFVKSETDSFAFHSTHSTLYIMTKHPTAFGATNGDFEAIGRFAATYTLTH